MRGGALPPAILCAALGLALASADSRHWRLGAFGVAVAAGAAAWVPLPSGCTDGVFLGCWSSTVLNALGVHRARPWRRPSMLLLCSNTGIWAGAVISIAGRKTDLLLAIPCTLTLLPAAWAIHRGGSIAVKVVSSWLIAVALLAAALQFLPVTPGYLPDHMD